jgi:hypothetical protein
MGTEERKCGMLEQWEIVLECASTWKTFWDVCYKPCMVDILISFSQNNRIQKEKTRKPAGF